MSSLKEAILSRMNIADVVEAYVKLTSAGKNFKAKSPFTNEKTASFFVSPDKNLFYCFSSQKGGDMFTFIQEMEGVDFKESLNILANRGGIDAKNYTSFSSKNTYSKTQELKDVLSSAQDIYKNNLTNEVKEYLKKRGLDDADIEMWGVGYAMDSWDNIYLKLKDKFKIDLLIDSGLIVKGQKQKEYYDRWRDRITLPLCNMDNLVVGWNGRLFGKNDKVAKYINPPATSLYDKSNFIYGLNFAKQSIKKSDCAILTEGAFDTILSVKVGYPNTVAISGTALSVEHLRLIKRFTNNIIIAFDGDSAGVRATHRAIGIALSLGMEAKITDIPEPFDPADLILSDSQKWKEVIKSSTPPIEYFYKKIKEKSKNEDQIERAVRRIIVPFIQLIIDPIQRDSAIQRISELSGISSSGIKSVLLQGSAPLKIQTPKKQMNKEDYFFAVVKTLHNKGEIPQDLKVLEEKMKEYYDEPDEESNLLQWVTELNIEEKETEVQKLIDSAMECGKILLRDGLQRELKDIISKLEDKNPNVETDIAKLEKRCKNIQNTLKALNNKNPLS